MTEIVMDAATESAPPVSTKCSTPGCIRPAPHEGMRHRFAPTKDLQPEPEPAPVAVPEPDRRPRYGSIEEKPYNHALSTVDDGIQVAWSHCATCLQHITRCECLTGPKEPVYITRWRTREFPINDPVPVDTKPVVEPSIGTERVATHICDSCGELLYLLDTPDGKRAYTVDRDENYCKVDDAGIHFARDITQGDRDANPDWFPADHPDVDDEAPTVQATDDPDYDEAAQQEAEDQQWAADPDLPTTVHSDSDDLPVVVPTTNSNIDPEVGF